MSLKNSRSVNMGKLGREGCLCDLRALVLALLCLFSFVPFANGQTLPPANTEEPQIILLDYHGTSNTVFDGPARLENLKVAPLNLPHGIATGEDVSDFMNEVCESLNTLYVGWNVRFVLAPSPVSNYSTIYVGGTNEAFLQYGDFLGIAESVDVGNVNPNDKAFVFSETIAERIDAALFQQQLIMVIAHESGHLLGLSHSSDALGGMMAGGFSNDGDSLWGEIAYTKRDGDGTNPMIDKDGIKKGYEFLDEKDPITGKRNYTEVWSEIYGGEFNGWKDDATLSAYANSAERWLRSLVFNFGLTVGNSLYDRVFGPYLQGNSKYKPKVVSITDGDMFVEGYGGVVGFKNAKETKEAVTEIENLVKAKALEMINSSKPLPESINLRTFLGDVIETAEKKLEFGPGDLSEFFSNSGNFLNSIPGFLAGGIGSSIWGLDDRIIDGNIHFTKETVNGQSTIKANISISILVIDSFDFAPGDPGGKPNDPYFVSPVWLTGKLHALEINDWAYAVKIEALYHPAPVSITIQTNANPTITPHVPPTTNFVILIDTTGSMESSINSVKNSAIAMAEQLLNSIPNIRIAVASFRDTTTYSVSGNYAYRTELGFSTSVSAIRSAINGLSTGGGVEQSREAHHHGINTALISAMGLFSSPLNTNVICLLTDTSGRAQDNGTGYTVADVNQKVRETNTQITTGLLSPPASQSGQPNSATVDAYFSQISGGRVIKTSTGTTVVDAITDAAMTGSGLIRASGSASSSANPSSANTVTFNSSSSYSTKGQIVRYEWDFYDNGNFVSSSAAASHTYEYGYHGDAVLRITDSTGLRSTTRIPVSAACVVTTNSDVVNPNDGVVSLREAVLYAKPGVTITFADSLKGRTITVNSFLSINNSVTIDGYGQNITIAGGGSTTTVLGFDRSSVNATVTVIGLTITGGTRRGLWMYSSNGTFNVIDCNIMNTGTANSGEYGAGIYSRNTTLNLINSSIIGCITSSYGGGIYMDGGTLNMGGSIIAGNSASRSGGIGGVSYTMYIDNSLIAGNKATGEGGGIYYYGSSSSSVSTIVNTTIVGNTASRGGGIYNSYYGINLLNSIVANNIASTNTPDVFVGNYTSDRIDAYYSLIGNTTTSGKAVANVENSKFNVDPRFIRFTPYTTASWTKDLWKNWDLRLQSTSPARDSGNNNYVASIFDLDGMYRISNDRVDIGAYEYGSVPIALSMPTSFQVTGKTATTISLAWNPVFGATSYQIQCRLPGGDWGSVTPAITFNGTRAVASGLTSGTTYQFRVRARNVSGNSPWSYSVSATTVSNPPPAAAPTLYVTHKTAATISLAWNPVPSATSYQIQCRFPGGDWGGISPAMTFNGTTTVVSGLTSGTTYQFRVRARNAAGNSPWSGSVSETTDSNPPPATAPTLYVTNKTAATISLAWNPVFGATSYQIQCRFPGGDWGSVTPAITFNGTTAVASGLTSGATYQFRVRARNAAGNSPWSGSVSETTGSTSGTFVTAIPVTFDSNGVFNSTRRLTNVDIYRFTVSTADLGKPFTFETFLPVSGTHVDTYIRLFNSAGGELASHDDKVPGVDLYSRLTYTFNTAGTYYLGVSSYSNRNYNPATGGSPGTSGDYRLTITAPTSVAPANAPANWRVTNKTSTTVSFAWNSVSGATSYQIQCRLPGGEWGSVTPAITFNGTTAVASGLTSGATYQFRVRARNAAGNSPWSGSVSETTGSTSGTFATAIPVTFDSNGVFNSTRRLTNVDIYRFTVSTADLGKPFTFGTFLPAGGTSVDTYIRLFSGSVPPVQLGYDDDNGRDPYYSYMTYTFNTAGTYYLGVSSYSNRNYDPATGGSPGTSGDYRLTITAPTSVAPANAPANWRVTDTTATTISFAWNSVSGATSYQIQCRLPGGEWGSVTPAITFNGTTAVASGLTSGTTYQFRIRARNAAGNSPWSGSVSNASEHGTLATAIPVTFDSNGVFNSTRRLTNVDIYRFTVSTADLGKPFTFGTFLPAGGTSVDTYIRLFSGAVPYVQLRHDDDSGRDPFYSYMTYTFNTTGTYYLGVSSFSNRNYDPVTGATSGEIGDYRLTITAPTSVAPANAPAGLRVTNKTSTTVSLAWNAVTGATSYQIQCRFPGGDWGSVTPAITFNSTTAVASGLTSGTTYQFRIRARNAAGNSPWSDSVPVTTDTVTISGASIPVTLPIEPDGDTDAAKAPSPSAKDSSEKALSDNEDEEGDDVEEMLDEIFDEFDGCDCSHLSKVKISLEVLALWADNLVSIEDKLDEAIAPLLAIALQEELSHEVVKLYWDAEAEVFYLAFSIDLLLADEWFDDLLVAMGGEVFEGCICSDEAVVEVPVPVFGESLRDGLFDDDAEADVFRSLFRKQLKMFGYEWEYCW